MRDERRATVAMSQLLADLAHLGAPLDVLGAAARVVHDETLHVELCAAAAGALDPSLPPPVPGPADLPPHGTRDLRRRTTLSVATLLCVGETLSGTLLREARDACRDPGLVRLLERMLRDESVHARFGWWWFETPIGRPRDGEPEAIARALRRLFGRLEASLGASSGSAAEGSVPPELRPLIYRRVVEERIVPGFEACGIPARLAWNERERP
jgi:hypothetical protein